MGYQRALFHYRFSFMSVRVSNGGHLVRFARYAASGRVLARKPSAPRRGSVPPRLLTSPNLQLPFLAGAMFLTLEEAIR